MEVIKDTIQNVMQALEAKKKGSSEEDPEKLLKQALSKKEQKHIKFNYFKKGILGINVDSSTWFYQLNLKKQDLLTRLNKKSAGVRDIRFRLGEIK